MDACLNCELTIYRVIQKFTHNVVIKVMSRSICCYDFLKNQDNMYMCKPYDI